MSIFEQSGIRGKTFLDRCITLPKYIITFYIEDKDSADRMLNEILDYYKQVSYDYEIETVDREKIAIMFFNGSVINLIYKDNMISDICSQVMFVDSRIRETYIREIIKPTIDQYVLGEGSAMLNPKPIYLNFISQEE